MLATQKVAKLLDKAFVDVGRTGMFLRDLASIMCTVS